MTGNKILQCPGFSGKYSILIIHKTGKLIRFPGSISNWPCLAFGKQHEEEYDQQRHITEMKRTPKSIRAGCFKIDSCDMNADAERDRENGKFTGSSVNCNNATITSFKCTILRL
jgi:hypothetical protein